MVTPTFIALRGLGTSHPGAWRAEGLLEAPGTIQGKTVRVSHPSAPSLIPLSYSSHTQYPNAISLLKPSPWKNPACRLSEIGLRLAQRKYFVSSRSLFAFLFLVQLTLCLLVSRKASFFSLFVCMMLGKSHSPQNGPDPHSSLSWESALCSGPYSTPGMSVCSPTSFSLSCPSLHTPLAQT